MLQRFSAANILTSVAGLTVMVCAGCSSSDPAGPSGTGGVIQASSSDSSKGGATAKSSTTKTGRGGTSSGKTSANSRASGGSESTSDSEASGGAETTATDKTTGGTSNSGSKSSKSSSSSTGGSSSSKDPSSGGKSSTGGSNSGTGGTAAGGASSSSSKTTTTGGSTQTEPSACPATALSAGDTEKTISNRKYVLHVPSKYDGKTAVPLIIDFHGITGNGGDERRSSPYPAQTDPDGVIMAFPTGASGPMGNAWNVGPCCVANVDDVAFAKAIVADIQKVACIDSKRVYAVGFSMGGGMSHYLACHAADVFAAVAPAAFDLLKENVDACKPARPISVISFRGTADGTVSYAGGNSAVVPGMPITFLGAKNTFAKWAELNQCTGAASAEDSKGCSSYSSCKDGVDVMLCTKQGGGHAAGDASVAWPILKKHTLP